MSASQARQTWLLRTSAGLLLTISVGVCVAYMGWVLLRGESEILARSDAAVSSWAIIFQDVAVVALGAQLALNSAYELRQRRGWFFIALATACNGVAELIWFYYETILQVEPFPSIADLFYLLYYPLILIGVMLFPFAPVKRHERMLLALDMTIVLIASGMVFWYFILSPMSYTLEAGLGGLIAIAYPIGDLLILTGVAALIQRDVEKVARGALVFLALGMIFTTFADALFAYFEVSEIAYDPAPLNILWQLSAVSHSAAALMQILYNRGLIPSTEDPHRVRRLARLLLPYAAASVGPVLLMLFTNSTLFSGARLRGLLFGTVALIVLVLVRQYTVLAENLRLYREMQRMAITDSLTQMYNRHFFNETFQREIGRARRYHQPLSVLLIDVDHFKQFNDTYGHLRGDEVLRTIALSLSSQLRNTDLLARYGGDEFVVILPETTQDGLRTVIAKMKSAVALHAYAGRTLSVSIGGVTFRENQTPEQLLEEADRELYRDKAYRPPWDPPAQDAADNLSQPVTF